MILAGGMSTRLYPLTKQVPKPLVPVAGEPITAHIMRWLQSFGYTDLAINVHYLADRIEAAFGDGSRYGVKLNYLHEAELMGSAGALKPLESFSPKRSSSWAATISPMPISMRWSHSTRNAVRSRRSA